MVDPENNLVSHRARTCYEERFVVFMGKLSRKHGKLCWPPRSTERDVRFADRPEPRVIVVLKLIARFQIEDDDRIEVQSPPDIGANAAAAPLKAVIIEPPIVHAGITPTFNVNHLLIKKPVSESPFGRSLGAVAIGGVDR